MGNDNTTKFWYDIWFGNVLLIEVASSFPTGDPRLCNMVDHEGVWALDSVSSYLPDDMLQDVSRSGIKTSETSGK